MLIHEIVTLIMTIIQKTLNKPLGTIGCCHYHRLYDFTPKGFFFSKNPTGIKAMTDYFRSRWGIQNKPPVIVIA